MTTEQRIADIITPTLLERGYTVVRVQFQGGAKKVLQIMIERMDGVNITVDDCADVSRAVSVLLDLDDPIHDHYILEVSSPGLDRPLVQKADFERFAGSVIKLELKTPVEGSRRFKGLLLGIEGDRVKIELETQKEVAEFTYSDIQKARLIPDYETRKSELRKR